MGNIRTIFDEESDLHDLRADPNMVIEIQKLVTEMLGANEHRRIGIRQEIVDKYGVAALPGVISATFVLTTQLSNRKNQQMLAELIRELAADNPGAIRMLVKTGVADNPFAESRAVMVEALAGLDAAQAVREMAPALLKAAERAKKVFDRPAARQFYEVLLQQGLGFDEALAACRAWFSAEYEIDEAVSLLSTLLHVRSERTDELLYDLLSLLERRDTGAKSIEHHLKLSNGSLIIPAIQAANRLLERERIKRSKPVEAMFEGAIAHCVIADSNTITPVFAELKRSRYNDEIARYWWQALSEAATKSCDAAKRAFSDTLPNIADKNSQMWGVVQLLFIQNGFHSNAAMKSWAGTVIDNHDVSVPDIVTAARTKYGEITERLPPLPPEGGGRKPPPTQTRTK